MIAARFVFCVHHHQPVDNFDHVIQKVCEDAYLPFIEAMERHPSIKFCAHYSGPLLEWIEKNLLDLFIRISGLVERGQMELLTGGFYEPSFSMIPDDDAAGQIEKMTQYLRKKFRVEPQGIWLAERVWEPHFPSLLARTGLRYTVLDDSHFLAAGLRDEQLYGHYITEDRGSLFRIFPSKERLRYAIPFQEPRATMESLRRHPDGATVVYADDGEKFGSWPGTKKHVYEDGWLEKFLSLIEEVRTVTFSEALKDPSQGRIYLPACSYREMSEWSLLDQSRGDYESLKQDLESRGRYDAARPFLLGGMWRNFRVKYPEANLMYGRMLDVSRKVAASGSRAAREELFRAQGNCAYWHGIFGGLYLPHLRDVVYRHLIQAENEIGEGESGVQGIDLDLDGQEEMRLTNPALNLFVSPQRGGQILELDVRKRSINLGATLTRRREHYHERILQGVRATGSAAELERHLHFDAHLRTSLVDHFFPPGAKDPSCGNDIGDFVGGAYAGRAGRREGRIVASLSREGRVGDMAVRVEKEILLPEEEGSFQVTYTIRAAQDLPVTFAVEFNIALLNPKGFEAAERGGVTFRIRDDWRNLGLEFSAPASAGFWVYPVRTVSQSESGFDLIYQGTAVVPRWNLVLAADRPWTGVVTFKADAR